MSVYGNNYNQSSYSPYPPPQDNRSAKTNIALGYLYSADLRGDRNGQFSRKEIDDASQKAASRGDQRHSEALKTFNLGGKHRSGLFPDKNGNGQLDAVEIVGFAGADGNKNTITPQDFKKSFPHLAKDGGNSYNPNQPSHTQGNYGGQQGGIQEIMKKLIMFLLQAFGGGGYNQGGGGYNTYNSAQQPY